LLRFKKKGHGHIYDEGSLDGRLERSISPNFGKEIMLTFLNHRLRGYKEYNNKAVGTLK